MIVGEAPGADEDSEGVPFVGRAGSLLEHVLEVVGILRTEVYITNTVKCRPSENKLPTRKAERSAIIESCLPYLKGEFQRVKPRVVLALGVTALQALSEEAIADIGQWQGRLVANSCALGRAELWAAYHPAYILRTPSAERFLAAALTFAARQAGMKLQPPTVARRFLYDEIL